MCSSFNYITQLEVTDCYLYHVRIMFRASTLRVAMNLRLKVINSIITCIYIGTQVYDIYMHIYLKIIYTHVCSNLCMKEKSSSYEGSKNAEAPFLEMVGERNDSGWIKKSNSN